MEMNKGKEIKDKGDEGGMELNRKGGYLKVKVEINKEKEMENKKERVETKKR